MARMMTWHNRVLRRIATIRNEPARRPPVDDNQLLNELLQYINDADAVRAGLMITTVSTPGDTFDEVSYQGLDVFTYAVKDGRVIVERHDTDQSESFAEPETAVNHMIDLMAHHIVLREAGAFRVS